MDQQKRSIIKSCKLFLIPILAIAIAACGGGDTTAPTISSISSGTPTTTSATITWTTDENAASQVDYGTSISYGTTVQSASLVTSHSVNLTGLTASTTYNYQVSSADASANSTTSGNNTFVTATPSGSVNFTWTPPTTNSDSSTLYDLAGYKLYYSVTSGNYSGATEVDVSGANRTSYLESTLGAGTYYAVIKAYDTSGNLSIASNEVTFIIL